MIQIKRAYEPAEPTDGDRVLVERLWPRGVSKDEAHLDGWDKEIAPSADLRKWYGHVVARWPEFQKRYLKELAAPEKKQTLDGLADKARRGNLTLVYGAKDTEHNSAVVLKGLLEREYDL